MLFYAEMKVLSCYVVVKYQIDNYMYDGNNLKYNLWTPCVTFNNINKFISLRCLFFFLPVRLTVKAF